MQLMKSPRLVLCLAALLVAPFGADRVAAQGTLDTTVPPVGSNCDYRSCALGIAPAWNGLAVVRGAAGPRVANLNFFWPRDISVALRGTDRSLRGADSAAAQARRAVQIRRVGAALTDVGLLLAATAAVSALRAGRLRESDGWVGGAGLAALGLSVPFQFGADGALSRAVWWHNLRFAH